MLQSSQFRTGLGAQNITVVFLPTTPQADLYILQYSYHDNKRQGQVTLSGTVTYPLPWMSNTHTHTHLLQTEDLKGCTKSALKST